MAASDDSRQRTVMSAAPRPLTACIITLNEEAQIADCLRSLDFCDEILVVDSHSTDRTREIAASMGARVIERDWPGYRSQKQFAVEAASHDWVVSLDADERLSPGLREEIRRLRDAPATPGLVGYRMPRMTRYFGQWIRHGDWYPDRLLRVFDRRHCRFGGEEVHEKVVPEGRLGTLRHPILHDSYESLDDQLAKLQRYARLWAEARHAKGKRARLVEIFFNPFWRFFRAYVLRLGLLDGWRGLAIALIEANYVRQKYLRLWMLGQQ
ncbi:MAG: glycosyltransferase family 2 protein [Gammaproteobacteria bacterium]